MNTSITNSSTPLIVIPSYNEAPAILLSTVTEVLALGYRVLVIDDGSDAPALDGFIHQCLTVVRHSINLGQGAALQTAITLATFRKEAIIVTFDADGQHDVCDIKKILCPLQEGHADVVLGSRFLNEAYHSSVPLKRRILLRMGIVFNHLLCGVRMSDAHNGLRGLNLHAMQQIRLRENRMAHATELIWQIKQSTLRWQEVPVNITYSAYSMQKDNAWWRALRIMRDVLTRRMLPDGQPIPGSTLLFWSLVLILLGVSLRTYGWLFCLTGSLFSIGALLVYRHHRRKLLEKTIEVRRSALQHHLDVTEKQLP
ncbi:glycosyltransferase family 2 protein [Lewinella sp. LCG006]|uniref:glycosyltransferase family 2 protein n=1 Tax=Lewinella sp. LCG006 TaxID=3231911 RepID=UPI0034605254